MGLLRGITGLHPSPHAEIFPYVAGNARIADDVDPADPYHNEVDLQGRAGLDLKFVGSRSSGRGDRMRALS